MSANERAGERPGPSARLRSGFRRHGVVPRPAALRNLLRSAEVRFTRGNDLALYADGRTGLAAMLEAIERAERSVFLESYIFRGDATGRRFVDALCRRAAKGLEVRVLVDAVGSTGLDPGLFADLRAAGGVLLVFNPLSRFHPGWAPMQRDHRKILAIDGALAFTGGLNIGDEYFHGADYDRGMRRPWRDVHVRVEGPAVAMLEAVFLESWFRAGGPRGDRYPAPLAASGGECVAVLADGPTYRTRRTRDLMLEALARARRRVLLVTPYFFPGRRLLAGLDAAVDRGVRVELLIAGTSDHAVLRWAAHAVLPKLIERGLRVFEYEGSMMHAKVAVFDRAWAIVGTSNLDRQSLHHSFEVNLVVDGGETPGRLAAIVESDLARARSLTAADLARRSLPARLRDRLAAFFLSRF